MVKTAPLSSQVLDLNRMVVRGSSSSVKDIVARSVETGTNLDTKAAISALPEPIEMLPCTVMHASHSFCSAHVVNSFSKVFQRMILSLLKSIEIFPVYLALNFAPALALRLRHAIANPRLVLEKNFQSAARSSVHTLN
jgi:hypothetical protein